MSADIENKGIDTTEIVIEKLVAGGEGLGFLDGKAVFGAGDASRREVRVRLTQRHRDFDRASLLSVLVSSPAREEPALRSCRDMRAAALGPTCATKSSLRRKLIVREAFRRVGTVSLEGNQRPCRSLTGLPQSRADAPRWSRQARVHGCWQPPRGARGNLPRL